jgi:hypothetical protein
MEVPRPLGDSRPMTMPGHSFLEILWVLTLVGFLLLISVGEGRRLLDYHAVHVTREEMASLIRKTRMVARIHGGATLRIHEDGIFVLLTPQGEPLVQRGPGVLGVQVAPRSRATPVDLHFGPTGLGRAASLTIDFHRGQTHRLLVLSSYGRVRREG